MSGGPAGSQRGSQRGISLPYFHSGLRATRDPRPAAKSTVSHCYHHKRYETAIHRPRSGHRRSHCRAHCRPTDCRFRAIRRERASCQRPIRRGRQPRRPGSISGTSRRECCSSNKPRRKQGNRRLPAPLPPRWWHCLARGHGHILPFVRNPLRIASLAELVKDWGGVEGFRDRCGGGFSLPGSHFFLARAAPIRPTCGWSLSRRQNRWPRGQSDRPAAFGPLLQAAGVHVLAGRKHRAVKHNDPFLAKVGYVIERRVPRENEPAKESGLDLPGFLLEGQPF